MTLIISVCLYCCNCNASHIDICLNPVLSDLEDPVYCVVMTFLKYKSAPCLKDVSHVRLWIQSIINWLTFSSVSFQIIKHYSSVREMRVLKSL